MNASDLMTQKVYTTTPQASVKEVARLLYRENISGVPVIDDKSGQLVGMITESDILKQHACGNTSVSEIMSRDLTVVDEDTPISEVAALLAVRHIKRVPVMHAGHIVGIVSRADIVQAVAMGELLVRPW